MIDDIATRTTAPVIFDAPAPGQWELETTHHGLRPLTPILRDAYRRAFEAGTVELVERYGLPLAHVQAKFVHGCLYVRPLGVGERDGSTPKAPPPALVMKLLAGLHPVLRRRAKTAAVAWQERRWRHEVDQWFDHDRSVQAARNLAPGRRAHRSRRRPTRRARRRGTRTLRGLGTPEPRDARRRPHAGG